MKLAPGNSVSFGFVDHRNREVALDKEGETNEVDQNLRGARERDQGRVYSTFSEKVNADYDSVNSKKSVLLTLLDLTKLSRT